MKNYLNDRHIDGNIEMNKKYQFSKNFETKEIERLETVSYQNAGYELKHMSTDNLGIMSPLKNVFCISYLL